MVNNNDEKEKCINNIITKVKLERGTLQKVCENCNNIKITDERIIKLIESLLKLMHIIYYIRFKLYSNGIVANKYDQYLILSISRINLSEYGLTLDELRNVKITTNFVISNMPKNLGEYFEAIQELSKPESNRNRNILIKYSHFMSDFQIWTLVLLDFCNTIGKDILKKVYDIKQIPNVRNFNKYNSFLKEKIVILL
jgi:uncharacterized protein YfaA (DUF2138 family)